MTMRFWSKIATLSFAIVQIGLAVLILISADRVFFRENNPIFYPLLSSSSELFFYLDCAVFFALCILLLRVKQSSKWFVLIFVSSIIVLLALFLSSILFANFHLEAHQVDSRIYRLTANRGSMRFGWKYSIYSCDEFGIVCTPVEQGSFTPLDDSNSGPLLNDDGTLNTDRLEFWTVTEANEN